MAIPVNGGRRTEVARYLTSLVPAKPFLTRVEPEPLIERVVAEWP